MAASKTISCIQLHYPFQVQDCTTTSLDITDDITMVESARESVKDKSKESAVWLFFEKTDEEKSGAQGQRVANCKECGKSMKVVKGNTSNLMSHLKTKHSKYMRK